MCGVTEWLRFLKQPDRESPKDMELHLVVDNYAPTNMKASGRGSRTMPVSIFISRQPEVPGSISSNASLPT